MDAVNNEGKWFGLQRAYHFVGDGGWRVGDALEKAEDFDVDGEVFADYVTTANHFEVIVCWRSDQRLRRLSKR